MKEILLSICFPIFINCFAIGQTSFGSNRTADIISEIELEILEGKKRSLRDIATFLDNSAYSKRIQQILIQNSFFYPEEINLEDNLTKEKFLSFYYDFEAEIKYSNSLRVFFITPFEEKQPNIQLKNAWLGPKIDKYHKFKEMSLSLEEAISNKDEDMIYYEIENISALHTSEGYEYLLGILKDKRINKFSFKQDLKRALYVELIDYSKLETVKTILGHVKNKELEPFEATKYLSYLTNIYISEENPNKYYKRYKFYLDSLKTLDNVINFGFEQMIRSKEMFYYEPVDFYGKILTISDRFPFIRHNAIYKLKTSKHPRALIYLANHIYKIQKNELLTQNDNTWEDYYTQLNELHHHHIAYQKADESYTMNLIKDYDRTAFQNFLLYWNNHYTEFEWNQEREIFINKKTSKEKADNYESYFKLLNSDNDSIAFHAFQTLATGDPNEIIPLTKKYQRLLRDYNNKLPSLKSNFLGQLVKLTDYCKKNKISTLLKKDLKPFVMKLSQHELSAAERYQLENQIIGELTLENVTSFEYYACIHERNTDLSYSAGRILKKFYFSAKKDILSNENELRHYLKKSNLFRRIDVMGSCNEYINLFADKMDEEMMHRIEELRKIEFDKDIKVELFRMQLSISGSNNEQLDHLLKSPLEYNKNKLSRLSILNKNDEGKIANFLKEKRTPQELRPVLELLQRLPKIEYVPWLIDYTLDQRTITKSKSRKTRIADLVNTIFESIYNYSFLEVKKVERPGKWNELWKKNGSDYKNWSKFLYTETVKRLKTNEKVNVNDINAVFASKHYKKQDKTVCMKAIQKLKPSKLIKLNTQEKLTAKNDLIYFEDIKLNYKNLDDLPKYFSEVDRYEVLDFMFKKAKDFELENRGSFYNNLFNYSWFKTYISSVDSKSSYRMELVTTLKAYLNESDFLSEFEERKTILHAAIVENIGSSLEESLAKSIAQKTDEATKALVQQNLIATIKYKEIPTVLKYIDQLSITNKYDPHKFLNTDFGLPIFDLDNLKSRERFLNRHKKMSEKDLYLTYLQDFGVDFTSNKKLDYDKVADILQYDIITPFISQTGGTLDLYSYSIVKILEKEFKTTLGFHKKLNESQTFFLYSNSKRATAWLGFLKRKKLLSYDKLINSPFSSK